MNRLATESLAIGYVDRTIAADITLSLAAGDIFCLLGPNGCGKTTLFRTLLGLLRPRAGTIRLDGRDLATLPRGEAARRIAYVPQLHAPTFPFSAADVVLMGRTPHLGLFARPSATDRRICDEALAQVGIEALARQDYTRLSGGQRQLVLIARALAVRAPVLVMDEPTASLDYGNRLRVLEQIRQLAANGLAVLFSTHDPDQVLAIGNRVVLMRDGAVLAQGPVDEVVDADRLAAVYGVAVDVVRLPDGRRACLPGRQRP